MRNLLIGLMLSLLSGIAVSGVYDEILDAAERGDSAAVVGLLQRGMDVNTVDREGNTLLMISARTENMELMKFLLGNGAAINRRNRFGDTALLLAAIKGSVAGVDLLHKSGAQLEPGGWSALHYSVFSESSELLGWLVKQGAKLDARAPQRANRAHAGRQARQTGPGQTVGRCGCRYGSRRFRRQNSAGTGQECWP
jgi:ankyrin repeat protein